MRWIFVSIVAVLYLYFAHFEYFFEFHPSVPDELDLINPDYKQTVSHTFGPGGINHSYREYELDDEVGKTIDRLGLKFLNNMESAINYPDEKSAAVRDNGWHGPYWTSFTDWKKLPIIKDEKWPRKSVFNSDLPYLAEFFGDTEDSKFTDTIDEIRLLTAREIIQGNHGYYSYGGYRGVNLIIVSPKYKKAYYLFRD